jgi:glutathione synthase/RimK-type ligase-like ATP-grasp enzyme
VVLIVTNRSDLTADWLILELQRRRAPFVRFNTEDYPERCSIGWDLHGRMTLRFRHVVSFEDVEAIWFRRPLAPRPRSDLPREEAVWAAREAAEALSSLWAAYDGRWVSRPDALRTAESKARQLLAATKIGFDVPDTIVTSDVAVLEELFARSPSGVVCKALTHGRVRSGSEGGLLFTSRIDTEHAMSLGPEPHLFQALVPKQYDVRVTVIGDEVFATRIESQHRLDSQLDWRRSSEQLQHTIEVLPPEVARWCAELVRAFDLSFGAIDLARRPDGGYTFFELNPNGQWAWVEQQTGVPLRARLVDLLLGV